MCRVALLAVGADHRCVIAHARPPSLLIPPTSYLTALHLSHNHSSCIAGAWSNFFAHPAPLQFMDVSLGAGRAAKSSQKASAPRPCTLMMEGAFRNTWHLWMGAGAGRHGRLCPLSGAPLPPLSSALVPLPPPKTKPPPYTHTQHLLYISFRFLPEVHPICTAFKGINVRARDMPRTSVPPPPRIDRNGPPCTHHSGPDASLRLPEELFYSSFGCTPPSVRTAADSTTKADPYTTSSTCPLNKLHAFRASVGALADSMHTLSGITKARLNPALPPFLALLFHPDAPSPERGPQTRRTRRIILQPPPPSPLPTPPPLHPTYFRCSPPLSGII